MFKRIFTALLMIFLLVQPLAEAAQIGYANQSCYVYAKASTSAAKRKISQNTKLTYVGKIGSFFKVRISGYKQVVYILKKYVSKTKISAAKPTTHITSPTTAPLSPVSWTEKVEKTTWSKGKNAVKVGKTATLFDIKNEIQFKIKRVGGQNHMDVEPATAADTNKLKKIVKKFSWTCHPMILMAGDNYIACSINSQPHGKQSNKKNNFNGHFCLHLLNSKTHGSNTINPEHQRCITQAYNWAHNN